jgi:hypothetical protein
VTGTVVRFGAVTFTVGFVGIGRIVGTAGRVEIGGTVAIVGLLVSAGRMIVMVGIVDGFVTVGTVAASAVTGAMDGSGRMVDIGKPDGRGPDIGVPRVVSVGAVDTSVDKADEAAESAVATGTGNVTEVWFDGRSLNGTSVAGLPQPATTNATANAVARRTERVIASSDHCRRARRLEATTERRSLVAS